MNMFKPVSATSVQEYLEGLPAERGELMKQLHALIQKTVPSLKPWFAYNMLGYGSFEWRNYKKQLIDWPVISLASLKNYVSLYVCSVEDGTYLAEKHKKDLGKATVGKSCISFKTLEDLNLATLRKVLKAAEKNPGFAGLGTGKKK